MKTLKININLNSLQKLFLKILINLNFAISIFFLISFYGLCGSVLEQEQSQQYYIENYNFDLPLLKLKAYKIIFLLDLDHIFSSYWFYLLIIILSLSLISCSLLRQLPLFLFSRGNKFFYQSNTPKTLQVHRTFDSVKSFSFTSFLSTEHYLTFQKRGAFYSYKGLLGKFAPLIVHFSLILILAGTSVASLTSFSAQELIPKSETFVIQNTIKNNLFSRLPNYSLRVNDFWIIYDEKENIKQYFSDISILSPTGKEEFQKIISVNNPLSFKNLVIYQTDWDLIALRLKFNDSSLKQIPLKPLGDEKKIWVSSLKIDKSKFYFLVNTLNGYISIYDESGQLIKQLEVFEEFKNFQVIDIIPRTGLQLKIDQGIPILYLGFLFLMLSIIFSSQYFPEIWANISKKKKLLNVVGKTNRQQLTFDLEIFKIFRKMSLN